ncbi:MAG: hypothetical protein RML72_05790 [Bacteroidia bacterium]|nr:hypothetical protein [Bacteroidia bacterium]MDW8158373.1 hypothetical protein [Bacteroidia bacterium]
MTYRNASGAENYQLQYWNGSTWINYEKETSRLRWQGNSPKLYF